MKLLKFSFLLSVWIAPASVLSQDTVTAKDAAEISYRAELIIHEYNDLLNIISSGQTDIKETKDLIENSYSSSRNKIFFDSLVMVEDDLNPAMKTAANTKDIPVSGYLNNFDLFYTKSDTPSIKFSDLKISNIKKGEYLYIKVYFVSTFKNKSLVKDSDYTEISRTAEIRFSKMLNKWAGTIMHIGFATNHDPATDTINDIKIAYASNEPGNTEPINIDSLGDAGVKTFEEKIKDTERKKQVETFRQEMKVYDLLIERGDKFLLSGEYASASKIFLEAQELKPYEIYPKIKLAQIRKQTDQAAISSVELFNQFITKAKNSENARMYEQAKGYYLDAFSQKPDEAPKYAEHLKELNQKIRIIAELEEKYISGLYKEAIKDYETAIKRDNTNSDYFLGRAKCYDKINDYARALKDYSRAIDLDNNNLEAIRLRADIYKRNNEPFKALADYKIYLTVDKSNVDIYSELSDIHVSTNNLKAAVEDLENALKVAPNSSKLYYKKGLLHLNQKDYGNALQAFNSCVELDSSNAVFFYHRAECKLFSSRRGDAIRDFITAQKLKLDSNRLNNVFQYAATFYDRAQQHMQAKNLDSAMDLISDAILLSPGSPSYRFSRAEFYYSQSKYKEAISNFDQAIGLDTKYQQAFYKRGLCYYVINEFSLAAESLNTAVVLNPQDVLALKSLGDSYFQQGEYQNTIVRLENCVSLINSKKSNVPEFLPEVYNILGTCYLKIGSYDKAVENTKNAIRIKNDYAEAYFNRGYAYYRNGRLDLAVEDILKALSFERHLLWNYTLAKIYFSQGQYLNAVKYYDYTIKEDSSSELTGIFYERGLCNFKLLNYASALPDFLASIESGMESNYIEFNNQLGSIYLNLNKYDSAKISFTKSLLKDSTDLNTIYGIASTNYLQNNINEALVWFEKLFKNKSFNANVIKKDKLILNIRDDKNFKALMKKYN
ncbi:MAG: tetratricopeptide repeat protein [Ferruginibacter sp.]